MSKTLSDPRYVRFRERLAEERARAGLTQQQLANRLKKPQSYVSKFENGERRLDPVEFMDIARAIGFDPGPFLEAIMPP